jgi:secondary thiamine-phosphate synthase enzyme
MVVQREFDVHTRARGTVEITADVAGIVRDAGIGVGVVNVFVRHSSCSVVLTENADPAVRPDLETLAARWAPDGDPAYRHDEEGDDDMAAHGRAILAGATLTVPVADGRMRLGTWQGLYLWEHRTMAHRRRVVVTVLG